LFREKALLDTASEKNGTIEAPIRVLEHSQALTRILFGHFGPQNRHLGPKGTKRAKRRDWLAERMRFELKGPFCQAHSFRMWNEHDVGCSKSQFPSTAFRRYGKRPIP
jgi:hypothetical protein